MEILDDDHKAIKIKSLKEYALCSCIKSISNNDTIRNDISFSILTELSDYNFDAYKKIDTLTKRTVSNIQPTQIADYNGKKPYLLSCIEYYDSKELDSLIKNIHWPVQ